MSNVKRYTAQVGGGPGTVWPIVVEDPNGSLVYHSDFVALETRCTDLQAALDKIEAQRAKWRAAKGRQRKREINPLRYDPNQTSIYGDDHVQELTQ